MTRDKSQRAPDEQTEIDIEADRREIERVSAEGRPASPGFRTGRTVLFISVTVAIGLILAFIVGAIFTPAMGAIVFVVFLLLGLVLNPTVWAARLRAIEREQVHEKLEEEKR